MYLFIGERATHRIIGMGSDQQSVCVNNLALPSGGLNTRTRGVRY